VRGRKKTGETASRMQRAQGARDERRHGERDERGVEVEELLEEINNGSLIRVRYGTRCWKITRDTE